jgi:hypothetical protein
MATAAVVDAKLKDDRRQELNRQIEEVRADLDRLGRTAQSALPDPTLVPPSGDILNRYPACLEQDYRQQRGRGVAEFFDSLGEASTWRRTLPRSAGMDAWWKSSGLPEAEAILSMRKQETDFDALERALQLEESDTSIAHRLPKTMHHLLRRRRDVHGLVTQLLKAVELTHLVGRKEIRELMRESAQSEGDDPDLQQRLWDVWRRREMQESDPLRRSVRWMQTEFYPRYPATVLNVERSRIVQATSELNDSIRAIFASDPPKARTNLEEDFRQRVVKICYNLLVAPLPPTIHTYSTILLGLDRMGQHAAANRVLVYMVYISIFEPTQQSVVGLFNHYKVSGNMERFGQLIRRCTALDDKPLKIRRKSFVHIDGHTQLTRWARTKDVALHSSGDVYERLWFSNGLINTIIDGLLWYDCLGQAVRTVAFCWGMGIQVLSQSLMQLMDQCVEALDEDAAFAVLAAFFRNPEHIWPGLTDKERREFRARLQRLMDLCGIDASAAELLAQDRGTSTPEEESAARQTRQRAYRVLRIKRGTDVAKSVIEDAQAAIDAFAAFEEEELGRAWMERTSQPASSAHPPTEDEDTRPGYTEVADLENEGGFTGSLQAASGTRLSSAFGS